MKVAYILPYLQKPGGWRNHACEFILAIRAFVEPVLMVSMEDYKVARALFPGYAMYPLPVTQMASLSSPKGLRSLAACFVAIRRGDFPDVDLVHSLEAYPTGLVGSWLARKLGKPHAITTHGTYGVIWYRRFLDRMAYEGMLRSAGLLCPVSHGTAQMVRQYFGPALTNTRVWPILNGNSYYKKIPGEWAYNRHIPSTPALLSVGDVKPRKGQHISLAAFARVKAQLPEARYWIAGNYEQTEYYLQLQAYIRAHNLSGVYFLGTISDEELRRHYQAASLFILTPQQEGLQFEGFGLVYLEAGAFGLPVVATRSGGVADAVKDGETGFLAGPGDIQEISAALLRLLTQPELARRMGCANRKWAETLTWERTAQEQYQAYQELLAAG